MTWSEVYNESVRLFIGMFHHCSGVVVNQMTSIVFWLLPFNNTLLSVTVAAASSTGSKTEFSSGLTVYQMVCFICSKAMSWREAACARVLILPNDQIIASIEKRYLYIVVKKLKKCLCNDKRLLLTQVFYDKSVLLNSSCRAFVTMFLTSWSQLYFHSFLSSS